jgi:hypothetical protein
MLSVSRRDIFIDCDEAFFSTWVHCASCTTHSLPGMCEAEGMKPSKTRIDRIGNSSTSAAVDFSYRLAITWRLAVHQRSWISQNFLLTYPRDSDGCVACSEPAQPLRVSTPFPNVRCGSTSDGMDQTDKQAAAPMLRTRSVAWVGRKKDKMRVMGWNASDWRYDDDASAHRANALWRHINLPSIMRMNSRTILWMRIWILNVSGFYFR